MRTRSIDNYKFLQDLNDKADRGLRLITRYGELFCLLFWNRSNVRHRVEGGQCATRAHGMAGKKETHFRYPREISFFFTSKEADDKHRLGMTVVSDFCLECRVIVKYRQSICECLLKIELSKKELFFKGNLRRVEEEETLLER